jgi:hypothetical protein
MTGPMLGRLEISRRQYSHHVTDRDRRRQGADLR